MLQEHNTVYIEVSNSPLNSNNLTLKCLLNTFIFSLQASHSNTKTAERPFEESYQNMNCLLLSEAVWPNVDFCHTLLYGQIVRWVHLKHIICTTPQLARMLLQIDYKQKDCFTIVKQHIIGNISVWPSRLSLFFWFQASNLQNYIAIHLI